MKVQRLIERRIELSPDEVYALLAAKYDLPTDIDTCTFTMHGDPVHATIGITVFSASEQELTP